MLDTLHQPLCPKQNHFITLQPSLGFSRVSQSVQSSTGNQRLGFLQHQLVQSHGRLAVSQSVGGLHGVFFKFNLQKNGTWFTLSASDSGLPTKLRADSLEEFDVVCKFRYVCNVSVRGYGGSFERAL